MRAVRDYEDTVSGDAFYEFGMHLLRQAASRGHHGAKGKLGEPAIKEGGGRVTAPKAFPQKFYDEPFVTRRTPGCQF